MNFKKTTPEFRDLDPNLNFWDLESQFGTCILVPTPGYKYMYILKNYSLDSRVKTSFLQPEIKPCSRKIRPEIDQLSIYSTKDLKSVIIALKMICKTETLPSYLPLKDVYRSNRLRSRFDFGFNVPIFIHSGPTERYLATTTCIRIFMVFTSEK